MVRRLDAARVVRVSRGFSKRRRENLDDPAAERDRGHLAEYFPGGHQEPISRVGSAPESQFRPDEPKKPNINDEAASSRMACSGRRPRMLARHKVAQVKAEASASPSGS